MSGIEVVTAESSEDRQAFLDYPYTLYRNNPHWVAPLRTDQKHLFDPARHPFHQHAQVRCFLAKRNGCAVGRVAGIWDPNYNEFHGEKTGFFGFYESEDDPDTARVLFGAVRKWLGEFGAEQMRGPMNPSTNYECGMLVDGFDSDPYVMMPYNPPYYVHLMESAGLRKAKDLLAYILRTDQLQWDKITRVASKAERFSVRPIRMQEFWPEVERIWKVYNAAWKKNWGFVPATREEFLFLAKEMRPVLEPELIQVGETNGEAVAFALALPNVNEALKHAHGSLFPLGLLKILYHRRHIHSLRVLTLGVVAGRRAAGVAAALYTAMANAAIRLGYTEGEFSWVLEDNVLMNRSLRALGARVYKAYRIYEWT
ncbi:MAG: hypothetical protein LLG20_15720 [Acidobacteriales bacterium]|nr:hypothetical protein [Terriglobales bacterium]